MHVLSLDLKLQLQSPESAENTDVEVTIGIEALKKGPNGLYGTQYKSLKSVL